MKSDNLSPHFAEKEFRCKCGKCESVRPAQSLLDGLEALRAFVDNRPIIITSGHRCAAHNAAVGGATDSKHITGRAADIVITGVNPQEITTLVKFLIPSLKALPYRNYTHIQLRNE